MMVIDRILQDRYGYVDASEIAQDLGVRTPWVHNRAHELELSSTPESKEIIRDRENQEQIYELHKAGVSDFEIAAKFDARVSDIRTVICAMGALECN